jgi:hypothetical protein
MSESDVIDAELGEKLYEDEERIVQQIAEAIAAKLRSKPQPARRDAHPKSHGCVLAEFRVENNLPPALAQGVFIPGKTYQAYIRFSNGNPDFTRPDIKRDVRGMAVKLLGVPGEKILPDERDAQTQDFLMANHASFFLDEPAHYLKLVQEMNSSSPFAKIGQLLAVGIKGALLERAMTSSIIANLLETRYWSQLPSRLGDPPHKQAIKVSARPRRPATTAIPNDPSPNYLRETLIKDLEAGDAQFDFEVQPRTSPNMSVEVSTVEWKESDMPFFKVATITIPRQTFATPERDRIGEGLSFTPWHALPQHRPLGSINRVRRVVYQTISKLRHELNRVPRREPSAFDAGMGPS